MIAGVEGAADGATLAVLPVSVSLNELICCSMLRQFGKNFRFDLWVIVIGNES